MPTGGTMQSPLPACATMWCSEFDMERVAASTDRARHNKHLLKMASAGVKKKQEEEEKKRLAKIDAVKEEKTRLKAEKAAQQAARVAAVKQHISKEREKRRAWEEKRQKAKVEQGKATASYRGQKIKALNTLAEQRRKESEEKVAALRKELTEKDRRAKEAFQERREMEIADVRAREREFRKMAKRELKSRTNEYLDEVFDTKKSLVKEKHTAIKSHEMSQQQLKKTLSQEQRDWQEEFEAAKRITREQRATKLKQLQAERAEFDKARIATAAKREKQAKAEIARLAEIDEQSKEYRTEFVETGVSENQQVKEKIKVEHVAAVEQIMASQALVLPSITTAAEKVKEEYKAMKFERAAQRARAMTEEATVFAARVAREYGVRKEELPAMPNPTPLTP